jgi:hypothetical protein
MHQLSILIKNPLIVIIHNILPLKHCQNNPYPPGVPKKYVAMMPPALPVSPEYLNTTVNPKESSQICSHGFHQPPGSFVQGGGGGRSGEGSVSFGYPPGRYCQWAGFVPEEVVRLAQMGEFQMTESCIQLSGEDR